MSGINILPLVSNTKYYWESPFPMIVYSTFEFILQNTLVCPCLGWLTQQYQTFA